MSVSRLLLKGAGGLLIVALFFFGTLYMLDYFAPDYNDPRVRDALRAQHAILLKNALQVRHRTFGTYPAFKDNPVDDLKRDLVDGGYLKNLPSDPMRTSTRNQYRYTSNGIVYGLLFRLEVATGKIPANGLCLTGVGVAGTGIWGQPPDCPF